MLGIPRDQKRRKFSEAPPLITTAAPVETKEKRSVVVVFHETAADVKNEADSISGVKWNIPCLPSVWGGAGGLQEQITVAFQVFQAPPNLLNSFVGVVGNK